VEIWRPHDNVLNGYLQSYSEKKNYRHKAEDDFERKRNTSVKLSTSIFKNSLSI
jgi:hypothetical protein